jgi:hypothetical protein
MKKLFTCILFLSLFSIIKGQDYNYAWLSDLHIGAPGAEADLQAAVNDINNRSEIKFVIITGNITERGYSSEFDKAKEILDQLTPPYYVIPGSHDTKWSDNGGTKFKELWKNDNFVFDFNRVRHIGISSAELRQGSGHISPETIDWLKSVLDTTENSQAVYLYVHHPMDSTVDNWFSVINMLKDKNLRAILTGYKEKNIVSAINGIPWAGCRPVLASKDTEVRPKPVEKKSKRKSAKKQVDIKSWGYTYVEDMPDSLIFYEVYSDSVMRRWGDIPKTTPLEIAKTDSSSPQALSEKVNIKWEKNLGVTLTAPAIAAGDRIFAAANNGIVHCYDLSGKEIWKYDTGGLIIGAPIRDQDVLAVATYEGDLFTINANNGKVIQVLSTGENLNTTLLKITVTNSDGKFRGIVVGTNTGKLLCYNMYSLLLIWQNDAAKGAIETEPQLVNDRLIYGSRDSYLYCLDANSGTLNWKWEGDKNFFFAPAAGKAVSDGKYVFTATADKNVTAIDFLLGVTSWKKNNYNSSEAINISANGENLIIKSLSDKVLFVSPKDGKIVKEVSTGHNYDTSPLQPLNWNNNIIMGTKSGIIYFIDSDYNAQPVLFTGNAAINGISNIQDNLFVVSNIDGNIITFELK